MSDKNKFYANSIIYPKQIASLIIDAIGANSELINQPVSELLLYLMEYDKQNPISQRVEIENEGA